MKYKIITTLIFISTILSSALYAQIEKVIVETYYISDANDATDTTGGILEPGTKTYRIYIDLMPGSKIRKIYGDENHALKFSSTEVFFNNKVDGQTFGKNFTKSRLQENTVALDTWITLGQATRISAKTYFGIPKSYDNDGSIIGGANNDGGSAQIAGGLLTNSDVGAGIPLTTSDGLDTMTNTPGSWFDDGFVDFLTGSDSTIFGSIIQDRNFQSNNASLQNSGVSGVDPDSNQVLIAQLTTKGEISFELNLEVEELDGVNTRIVKYVADGSTLLNDERQCAYLKYPSVCGCRDPQYVEYSPSYSCDNNDSCRTLIKFGCMDSLACNFDPAANLNVPSLCCYPGYCADRDISVVCPQLIGERLKSSQFELYPNPAKNVLTFQGKFNGSDFASFIIYDSYGRIIIQKNIGNISGLIKQQIDISGFSNGLYLFMISVGEEKINKLFIKE